MFSFSAFCWKFCLFLPLLFSLSSQALELEHLVTFNKIEDTEFNWQQITPHPTQANHFYVFSKQGEIKKIVNGEVEEQVLLNLASLVNTTEFSLTALTLHPNFDLKDLPGYQTFYTAHQETYNANKRAVRLPKSPLENTKFDLIVNEWLLADGKQADLESKREIIRIASPEQTTFIQHLSFNPYLKPWQDDFGALHLVMNQAPEHNQIPLYSGVILRINPDKFGLRNYTIPESNIFNSNAEIENEIIALGAKNITKILWQKRNNQQWLAFEDQISQRVISLINNGDDLRKEVTKPVWQGDTAEGVQHAVWYEGRKLSKILYKLISLSYTGQQWQLSATTIAADKNVEEVVLTNIPNQDTNAKLGLSIDNTSELLLVNINDGVISHVHNLSESSTSDKPAERIASSSSSDNTQIYLWLVVIIFMASGIYIVKRIRAYDKEKALVRKLYARFELTRQGQNIDLYKRHKKLATLSIPLKEIAVSKILLNDEVINLVDETPSNVFNKDAKSAMNHHFVLEHRLKMVDDRARTIKIELMDINKNKYQICLYARRGNQRYTRIDYQECLNLIVNWCWTISEAINSHHSESGKRNIS